MNSPFVLWVMVEPLRMGFLLNCTSFLWWALLQGSGSLPPKDMTCTSRQILQDTGALIRWLVTAREWSPCLLMTSVHQYQSISHEISSTFCFFGAGVSFHVLTLNYQNPSTCLKKITRAILFPWRVSWIPCWPLVWFSGLAGKPLRRATWRSWLVSYVPMGVGWWRLKRLMKESSLIVNWVCFFHVAGSRCWRQLVSKLEPNF